MGVTKKDGYKSGLGYDNCVGRFGDFERRALTRDLGLTSCAVHGLSIFTCGKAKTFIGEPTLALNYSLETAEAGWTGRRYRIKQNKQKVICDYGISLPGPMYTSSTREFGFTWGVCASSEELMTCPDKEMLNAGGMLRNVPQIFVFMNRNIPCLVVCSQAAESLEIISHEHWWFTFPKPGGRIMIVPLLDINDAPDTREKTELWLRLIENPPIYCSEKYLVNEQEVHIQGFFQTEDGKSVNICPVPSQVTLLGNSGSKFISYQPGIELFKGIMGPYAVYADSNCYEYSVANDWWRKEMKFTRSVEGTLSELPDELAYSGDESWDEREVMDSLMSLRIWAPFADILPPKLWQKIKSRVCVPSPESFRESLTYHEDPLINRKWGCFSTVFADRGIIAYDHDWYNGLALAGLGRAVNCPDADLANRAQKLSDGIRREREDLLTFMEIYSDWSLLAAWTIPQGDGFDYDCSHNALDGIVAEVKLRESEGNIEGRDYCLYLAARFALCHLADFALADHAASVDVLTFSPHDPRLAGANDSKRDNFFCGCRIYRACEGAVLYADAGTCPTIPAPNFPEFCALIKMYGPLDQLKELAKRWWKYFPERYEDWFAFYVGEKEAKELRTEGRDPESYQELREQAAVFYHVAHDVALRVFVLGEDPDEVEALYQTPLPLSEQLYCRTGAEI